MSHSVSHKRIAKNTLMLYMRRFFVIVVQLYTVPLVLRNLGVSDYGLYNVVSGMVTMFSFLSNTLTSGTQRYLSFALGKNDKELVKNTFRTINTIFFVFAIALFLIVEIVGLWLLHFKMNVPEGRMFAADCVFQLSALSFSTNVINVPYNSAIIAHERMGLYAYVSIFECLAKLALAGSLSIVSFDKLIYYAIGIFILLIALRIFYRVYCLKNFEECQHVKIGWDSETGKSLLGYSGWNMVGTLSRIGRDQGLNILMNMFYGTLLNAAHGIAMHINGVLTKFSGNLYMATRPPIIKLYASGNVDGMWKLVFKSSKLAFFLLSLSCVPIIVEMEDLLKLWLHEYPEYTVGICNIMILTLLIKTLVNQLMSALQAFGRIKKMQRNGGIIMLMCLPISYILMKFFNVPVLSAYYVVLALSAIEMVYLVYLSKKEIQLSVGLFLREVVFRDILVFVLTLLPVYLISQQMESGMFRIICSVLSSLLISISLVWVIGLEKDERQYVRKKFVK